MSCDISWGFGKRQRASAGFGGLRTPESTGELWRASKRFWRAVLSFARCLVLLRCPSKTFPGGAAEGPRRK
eukprot:2954699-Alexandrium_andersonii.AAC.1